MFSKMSPGVPVVAQQKQIRLGTLRFRVRSLASLGGSDPVLLWCRLAAAAPILPLAWELPYIAGVALKRKEKKKVLKQADMMV